MLSWLRPCAAPLRAPLRLALPTRLLADSATQMVGAEADRRHRRARLERKQLAAQPKEKKERPVALEKNKKKKGHNFFDLIAMCPAAPAPPGEPARCADAGPRSRI